MVHVDQPAECRIDFVNHASVLLEIESVKLLSDPWYFGSCFRDGWGLRYDNRLAFSTAQRATHLWISHYHEDHFHVPTLKELLRVNPEVVVVCNESHNFGFHKTMRQLGFKNLLPFYERTWLPLSSGVKIKRFPTTGIDSMLQVKTADFNLLNFNDCNIPNQVARAFSREIGPLDLLLNNFNHAEKILTYPAPALAEIQTDLKDLFKNAIDIFNPTYVIPFASQHYYRASESQAQNDSMLTLAEMVAVDPRVINLPVGAAVTIRKGKPPEILAIETQVVENSLSVTERGRQYGIAAIGESFNKFRSRVRRGFFGITPWIPPITVRLTDLGKVIRLDVRRGMKEAGDAKPIIALESAALYDWFDKPYGTSSAVIGAHFSICENPKALKRWILAALLTENKLDLRGLISSSLSFSGVRFLFNRREEIIAVLAAGKLRVGGGSRR